MKNLKIIAFFSILIAGLTFLATYHPSQVDSFQITIPIITPPSSWIKYETPDFIIYYPKDRQEVHIEENETHDGFALCQPNNCSKSEVSVYITNFVSPEEWLNTYKKTNQDHTIVIYPNLTIAGNSGIGSVILPSKTKLDTAVIEYKGKTYGITLQFENELHHQILSTLKFK